MPQRESAPIGAPCWCDVMTSDPEKAKAFYGELFGWTVEDPGEEYGGYFNFLKDGQMVAGGMRNDGQSGTPDVWSVYLATDDAEKTVETAVANGGQVLVPAMQVMEIGTMAVVTDAGQAAIGTWQPGLHKGFTVFGDPGTPSWFELHTRNYEASVRFYQDVFKWETNVESDVPEFRYTTLVNDGEQLAGIMDASAFLLEGVPAHWSVYFGVDDADATLAKVADLGGAVVLPAEDTPYGRLAQGADPTGALFKIRAGA